MDIWGYVGLKVYVREFRGQPKGLKVRVPSYKGSGAIKSPLSVCLGPEVLSCG